MIPKPSHPSPRAGICMYGRTGFIAREVKACLKKAITGSIYCQAHRDAALRRVPAFRPDGGNAA